LNNPRQLSLVGDNLLVAEAGNGGPPPCFNSPEFGETCLGKTGSVTLVRNAAKKTDSKPVRVVKGLVSAAGPDGTFATGADGVSALWLGKIYSIETFAPPEALPPGFDGSQLGKLLLSHPFGTPRPVADISGFERKNDPDKQGFDSNPYAVLVLRDRVLVADAAGNDIIQWKNGKLSTFAVLPNVQTGACKGQPNDNGTTGCDAVPTSLAQGRDGSIYVGGLSAETPNEGRVYKLDRRSGKILRSWSGLTAVTGVAVGHDGTIYASQLFTKVGADGPDITSGKLTKIQPNGARTSMDLPLPAGVVVDRWGTVFVSVWSVAPATGAFGIPNSDGQVWRLRF
jgi:hypothetical protein